MRNKLWQYLFITILFIGPANHTWAFTPNRDHSGNHAAFTHNKSLSYNRWIWGLGIGGYFANSSTANYYNGSGEHNLETALNRQYNRDRLISLVNEIIETFEVGELPQNMRYDPSMMIGFFGGYYFSQNFGVIGAFNYTRLNVSDRFTLITDKFTGTSEPYRLLSNIYATEERIDLRLGFQYTRFGEGYLHPFMESGISITDTKIIENRATISNIDINIREIRTQIYEIRDYGMGFGIYTAVGLHMEISDQFSFRAGVSASFSQINVGDNRDIRPQYTLFVRLNLNEILATGVSR